jgi:hypothetical protein
MQDASESEVYQRRILVTASGMLVLIAAFLPKLEYPPDMALALAIALAMASPPALTTVRAVHLGPAATDKQDHHRHLYPPAHREESHLHSVT